MELVYVPAGDFLMGTREDQDGHDDERPQHTVFLGAFWIDRTEVTAAQYQLCVAQGACSSPDPQDWYNRCTYSDDGKSDHPITCVNWYQAADYCAWAGRRLPTEAEWEKAARGTDGRIWPWGNERPDTTLAHFNRNRNVEGTAPVGSYPTGASPYGTLDMAGNAYEWVADWWNEDIYAESAHENPTGPGSGSMRVIRGGSWYGYEIRAADRFYNSPDISMGGFRCARLP